MRIGIDIDGVLTDEHNYIIDNGTKFFYEKNIPYVLNKDVYDNARLFSVEEYEYDLFWKHYFMDYINNIEVRPYAVDIINKLKNENHEIIIITARPFTTYENKYKEEMQMIAKNWLVKNKINCDDVVFSDKKLDTCKELGIDVMIEDRPENVLSVSSEIPVLCYDQPYNDKLSNSNISRCYSWYDIYQKIQDMK